MEARTATEPVVSVDPALAREELQGRRIGPHVALSAGLGPAVVRARAVGATAIQIFADNPAAWQRRVAPRPGVDAFRAALERYDIGPLAVHAPYLVNLATPDVELRDRSVEVVIAELTAAATFGARFLNVHIGSHRGAGVVVGTRLVGESLARILASSAPHPDQPLLVLEDSAGQGDSIGVSLDELGAIFLSAQTAGADLERLGVCLDTAHLRGAGYAIDDPDSIDRMLLEFDATLGARRLAMLHLNDARPARGSRQDRHAHLGAGRIGLAGLRYLLRHPRLANVPAYLETPDMEAGGDAVNMDRVRRLLGDMPIDELRATIVPGA